MLVRVTRVDHPDPGQGMRARWIEWQQILSTGLACAAECRPRSPRHQQCRGGETSGPIQDAGRRRANLELVVGLAAVALSG